jgi:hypothetical protein
MAALLVLGLGGASAQAASPEREHAKAHAAAPAPAGPALAVPASIRKEHQHLHQDLDAAIAAGGKTGAAARAVADLLAPHFEDEEAFAMPPLGLLGALARNEALDDEQVRQAIAMAERLRADYDRMLAEHVQIRGALHALAAAANEEHQEAHAAFAEALVRHAESEEELLYPTTLLIGEYLELRRGPAR